MINDKIMLGLGLMIMSSFFSLYTFAQNSMDSAIEYGEEYSGAVECAFKGIPVQECMNISNEDINANLFEDASDYYEYLDELNTNYTKELEKSLGN